MKFRELGNTGEMVSAIGFGCMPISEGVYSFENNQDSIKTLEHTLDLGINFWDTADIYGINNSNEILISSILKSKRDKIFLGTKFGFRLKNGENNAFKPDATYVDGSPEYVKEACDNSLKRLKTDYIDLYYAHRVDKNIPIEETIGAMSDLVKQGKVRYIGLSECTLDELKRAQKVHKITAVQSEFSILTQQQKEEIIPYCKENGIAFIAFSPLCRGLLTAKLDMNSLAKDDFRNNLPRFKGDALKNNQEFANEFNILAQEKNCTSSQLSLAWVLSQGEHIIPIPGTKRIKYLEENAKSIEVQLTEQDLTTINELILKYPNVGERYTLSQSKFLTK